MIYFVMILRYNLGFVSVRSTRLIIRNRAEGFSGQIQCDFKHKAERWCSRGRKFDMD